MTGDFFSLAVIILVMLACTERQLERDREWLAVVQLRAFIGIVDEQNGRNGNPNAEPRAAKFGERNKVIANVYAPNGTLWLKEKTEAEGAFIAKWAVVGEEVELKLVSGW